MPAQRPTSGFTLIELLVVMTVLASAAALGWSNARSLRDAAALRSAARQVTGQLALARRLAVHRREIVRVVATGEQFALMTPDGRRLAVLPLRGDDRVPVDSLRVRPRTMRFNPRGQAAPGSVTVYRGSRSIRVVSNFLGRLRVEPVRRLP